MSKDESVYGFDRSHTRKWRIPELFPDLDKSKLEALYAFYIELIHFNGRINLISPSTEENADLIHFADCILAASMILDDNSEKTIFDVGSGNGLPGIIFAILAPERSVVCVEKDTKKAEFLKFAKGRLGLDNIDVAHHPVQEFPEQHMTCVVSRAFAPIPNALLSTRKAIKINGAYYHMKSDSWSSEVSKIPSQAIPYWETKLLGDYNLPILGNHYYLVKTTRVK